MFTKENIDLATKTLDVLVWRQAFKDTPSWEQFILHCHDRYWNEKFEAYAAGPKETIIHGVNLREHFYLLVVDAPIKFFPQVEHVDNYLKTVIDTKRFGRITLVNFVGGETPINVHSDPRHSFYWQTKGHSTWRVWKNKPKEVDDNGLAENPDLEITMEEGDILFVPHGVFHSIDTPVPRTAISFMYEVDDSITECDCHNPEELHQY